MRKIALTQGKFALVDDEDYESLVQYRWYAQKHAHTSYAVRTVCSPMKEGIRTKTMVYMHQQVLGLKGIDHRDRNGLNNQRQNLRPATNSQNAQNHRKKPGSKSRFLGVTWHKENKVWRAQICVEGRRLSLGCYPVETEAARAYDAAALSHFGVQANVNFPRSGHSTNHAKTAETAR
jgi:hypothetical protein